MTIKHAEVEYIESGTFQGGEEDTSKADIAYGEDCVVLSKKTFDALKVAIDRKDDALRYFEEQSVCQCEPDETGRVSYHRNCRRKERTHATDALAITP